MAVVDDIRLIGSPPIDVDVAVDEAAARRALRDQIARLERQLGDALVSAFPHVPIDVGVPAPARGPRILSFAELEDHRDALSAKLREARLVLEQRGAEVEANRVLLERMLQNPRRHKFARLHRAEVDMGGCGAYQVRPRLGLIGMLAGWWHVKLSSGCPLAT